MPPPSHPSAATKATHRWERALLVGLAMSATGWGAVGDFKVTTDRSVDPSSLQSIVQGVDTRSRAQTNDERAIALYEWLHQTIFHGAYPTEATPDSVGPLKIINVYGWALCGGQHTVLKALFETAGWPCRYVGWSDPGHTTIEVHYDGRWHYFDVFLKCYFWSKDRSHIVCQEEIAADPSLVLDAVQEGRAARQHLCCGDDAAGVVRGCIGRKVVGDAKGWESVTWRDQRYSPALTLPAGTSLRLEWTGEPDRYAVSGPVPLHTCGTRDFRHDTVLGPLLEHYGPRNWSNGRLSYTPNFRSSAELGDIALQGAKARDGKVVATDGQGVALFRLPLPYAYVSARVDAGFDGTGRLSLSTDGGKTWASAPSGDISAIVKQKYELWCKAEFAGALTAFSLQAVVEHNRGAQPYLVVGENNVTVSAALLPLGTKLTVALTYQEATVSSAAPRTSWDGRGLTYRQPTTVTKDVSALPATFAINVGGNTPPKMISLERTVRGIVDQ